MTTRFGSSVIIAGDLTVGGSLLGMDRDSLALESLTVSPLDPSCWRVHDALGTNLPNTPATDDLGLVGGTFGTAVPTLQTEDLKSAGATNKYARCLFRLPPEFATGGQVRIRASAGMLTTVADTACTLDFAAFRSDRSGAVDGADLVQTAAQSINSLTLADKTFILNGSLLLPGDLLDIRAQVVVNDAATGTTVKAILAQIEMLLDIRG